MTTETMTAPAGSRIEAGPRGAKPKTLTASRVGIYLFLILAALFFLMPLWVMVVTSLKTMPEIQLRNIFQWPQQITFEPWLKAWDTACTGRDCNGLKPGFLNSVKITVVGTTVSIIIACLNGYALSFWRYKGANVLFGLLVFGAFVPYQVVIYPLIVGFRELGIFGTFPGIILIHTIFGMPILTLLFRNFFAALPPELFKAARVDGQGSGRSSSRSWCRWPCRSPSWRSSCRSRASGTTSCSAPSLPVARTCR
jgi:glucose/mannose transport system permease protein